MRLNIRHRWLPHPLLPLLGIAWSAFCGGADHPSPKRVPRMQVIPLPHHQASFQRDGRELTRYHYSPALERPFLHPILGASGRSLTRMGHPHDPESHSHHNSVWISHHDVDGVRFWDDHGQGTIRHQRIGRFEDGPDECLMEAANIWQAEERVLLLERRRITVRSLAGNDWMILLDIELRAPKQAVTLGETPFGLVGVRMAKTIGVHDGGGTILNSEGGINEERILWKPARWVDYSGPILDQQMEGITLMDHPVNPNHPTDFHVRNDGWMGTSLTRREPRVVTAEAPLRLRYGLFIHEGAASKLVLEEVWKRFCDMAIPPWDANR